MYQFILLTIQFGLRLIGFISPSLAGKLSFRLFCDPQGRSKVRGHEAEMMLAAHIETVAVNDKQVVVYRWGDTGTPVLLVHGWESRAARFVPLITELLKAGYQPIAFDAPGHGDSQGRNTTILEYQQVINIISQRHPGIKAVVGHSFGVLSTMYAVNHGLAVDKIIAISGVCDFTYLSKKFANTLKLSRRTQANLNQRIEGLFEPYTNIWQRFSATSFVFDQPDSLLIIHDKDDDTVDFAQAEKLHHHHQPSTPLMVTEKLGHSKTLTDPKIISSIVEFIHD